jgi:protein-L-isoaspartate(D-aspartate) O-methyltransferase
MKWLIIMFLLTTTSFRQQEDDRFLKQRTEMVAKQIAARGITDGPTLRAMRKVPRHLFVPGSMQQYAYDDNPLAIGHNQTISQPLIVAWMTELTEPGKNDKALEIGTGSGYQAAILAEIVASVYTIEIIPELAVSSTAVLKKLGYENIITREGDGYLGWEEEAPFDIIIVTAACDHIPQPLLDQLAENGRLVMPLGNPATVQELVLVTRKNGRIKQQTLSSVRFVPLLRK